MQCSGDKGHMETWAPTRAQKALKLLWLLEQRGKGTILSDGAESSLVGSHEGFANAYVQVQNWQGRQCRSGFLVHTNGKRILTAGDVSQMLSQIWRGEYNNMKNALQPRLCPFLNISAFCHLTDIVG